MDMGILSASVKLLIGTVVILGGTAGGAYYTGAIQEPAAGIQDTGDWGEVTSDKTEIVTTLWVDNPNQIGFSVGGNLQASYQLYLNGVNLAEGTKEGVSVPPGNNTVAVTTELRQQRLPSWWVAFVDNNETIPVRATPSATVSVGPLTASPDLPTLNRTLLAESTPVNAALSQAASAAEGRYTETVTEDQVRSQLDQGIVNDGTSDRLQTDSSDKRVTIGYEIRRGWAEWGEVNEETTTVHFHFLVYNPSETVCMPAEPENLGVSVSMNDNEMFVAEGDDTSLRNVSRFTGDSVDACEGDPERPLIPPQETREVVYSVQMKNDKIDDWFTSHVRQDEQTDIRSELQFVFSVGETTFRIPEDSPAAYTCELQTGILVDDQETSTTCGRIESVDGIETTDGTSEDSDGESEATPTETESRQTVHSPTETSTETSTATPTSTPTSNPPDAVANANPTRGEAPLTVSFDGTESVDPDGDISRYLWRFKDGSSPAEGATVEHTFQTTGEYEVELVVFDSEGNQDSATVTVTVDSRVG